MARAEECHHETSLRLRLAFGLVAGAAIATVDNFAFGGEVSPIVIVGMLLIAVGSLAIVWGKRASLVAVIIWIWLPGAHLVMHAFGLPDTIHPNTYSSIVKLGLFSFAIAAIAMGIGLMLRRALRLEAQENA